MKIHSKNKKNVAVIGIGGIGLRHLQSCANLPSSEYEVYAVDILPENLQEAEYCIKESSIQYLDSMDLLPSEIDVAIVATQANVRAQVTRDLVEKKCIKAIVLEKVLFQKIEDYEDIKLLFEKHHIRGFVNCHRRLWPAYKALKKELKDEIVTEVSVKGSTWDMGCNGIHYIDLIGFLLNSDYYRVTQFRPESDLQESKRVGALFIAGELEGVFKDSCCFILSTLGTNEDFKEIRVVLKNSSEIVIKETASSVKIYRNKQLIQSYKIPFQSELTENTVHDICINNKCGLTPYTESQNLHLIFMDTIFNYLKKIQPGLEGCPIT